jgi:hypothetical protein
MQEISFRWSEPTLPNKALLGLGSRFTGVLWFQTFAQRNVYTGEAPWHNYVQELALECSVSTMSAIGVHVAVKNTGTEAHCPRIGLCRRLWSSDARSLSEVPGGMQSGRWSELTAGALRIKSSEVSDWRVRCDGVGLNS